MEDPTLPPMPRRTMLKRAKGLLNSRGEPVMAVKAVKAGTDPTSAAGYAEGAGALKRATSLGASITRRVSSIGRSLSFKPSSTTAQQPTKTRTTRAFSESLSSRPVVKRNRGSAPDIRRRSAIDTTTTGAHDDERALQTIQASPVDDANGKQDFSEETRKLAMDIKVPQLLIEGTPMTKISAKKQRKGVIFRLDPDQGQIRYETKKLHIVPIECIKEIRTGADARYYRQQFQLSHEHEDRWLTITYICDGNYKTLHIVAATRDVFAMWDHTLRRLYEIRKELMSGLGNGEVREAVWARQYWAGADGAEGSGSKDDKLDFEEVVKMCRRLNISSSGEELMRLFRSADTNNKGVLDFPTFQHFVKLLKARPELKRLYKRLRDSTPARQVDFAAFKVFMRESQKSKLNDTELERVFRKYASDASTVAAMASPMLTPEPSKSPGPLGTPQPSLGAQAQDLAAPQLAPSPSQPPPAQAPAPAAPAPDAPEQMQQSLSGHLLPPPDSSQPPAAQPSASDPPVAPTTPPPPPLSSLALTLDGLTAFLFSPDNSPFADASLGIHQDMTHPLSDYYISSSHNTYLVGHQLVGDSTIEGYIRALLHSCRSVELDIYDGEIEPAVYHGKTFTSRVPVREICRAIAKYAFVSSPYPIIISAEVHCNLGQQELMAKIFAEEFGDALVSAPIDGRPKIEVLPSPEELKGRVLLKAKNLYVSESQGLTEKGVTFDAESDTTTSTSEASDSEPLVKEIKGELSAAKSILSQQHGIRNKARGIISHVRNRSRSAQSPSPNTSPATQSAALSPNTPQATPGQEQPKMKMSFALVALLVYTVGVKCRGINKKETYAPEHVFSLSESTANKILRQGMMDLIKHNRTHLVRIYPKGMRVSSTNYEPHRYWSAGAQLVALNWQTFDVGYMINHAMFQRNGRAGYVLKPQALIEPTKDLLKHRTKHFLDVTIISAQQLPRRKNKLGHEVIDKSVMDPLVEVSVHVPDWTHAPFLPSAATDEGVEYSAPTGSAGQAATTARTVSFATSPVKNNGFNPVWEETFSLPFDCVGDMKELVFVRFTVKEDDDDDGEEPIALYCASLGSLEQGYRHLPLHDAQISQYLFSTLFVHINIRDA